MTSTFDIADLTIRRSKRAKHMRLQMHPERGLEIVLPDRMSDRAAHRFAKANFVWIEKHLDKHNELQSNKLNSTLLTQLNLKAINEVWQIQYQSGSRLQLRTNYIDKILFIKCDLQNKSKITKVLQAWIKNYASDHFKIELDKISNEIQLEYSELIVRWQKTVWGTCSPSKVISINAKLLLMSYDAMRYVMIHELCHTVHMNHSVKFWKLVARFVPNYREVKRLLSNQHMGL